MNKESIYAGCEINENMTCILRKVRCVVETSDVVKIAQMLSTGEWIAICATPGIKPVFSLGRIVD